MVGVMVGEHTDDSEVIRDSVPEIIRQRSLNVVYQPIIDHGQNTVLGYEALTRPCFNNRMIPPDIWFRTAFHYGCSTEADLLALSCILEDATSLPTEAAAKPLFINVMPTTLGDSAYLKELEKFFNEGLCRAGQLVLEVVEYTDYDRRSLGEVVRILQSFGICIALDDFGPEGVGVDIILELKPDFVKIDRSFVPGIDQCLSKRTCLANLVQHINPSNHAVIVEGIESVEELFAVQDVGVSFSQGYYWGRPAPSGEVSAIGLQIEAKRRALIDIVQEKNSSLTDSEVIRQSQQLDRLIVQYHRLTD